MKFSVRFIVSLIFFSSFIFLTACSKTVPSAEPYVLGTPPTVAYLGVAYEYNFGAAGGSSPVNFSLGGAPDWLALELVNNTARQGAIARGVPGITGGRNGVSDLGKTTGIKVSVNDGSRVGSNTFSVEVKDNVLQVLNATVTEGKPSDLSGEIANSANKKTNCSLPDVSTVGVYNGLKTYPVVIPVTLAHPSVEPVKVSYKLTTDYATVDSKGNPLGEGSLQNQFFASNVPGSADYVSRSKVYVPSPTDKTKMILVDKPLPPYLKTTPTGGVVTFEPGITRCYIVADVVDDFKAEAQQVFHVKFDKVIEGLASFTGKGAISSGTVRINDNEPKVSFTQVGGIINEGTTRHFQAKLDRVVNRKIIVNLVSSNDISTQSNFILGSSSSLTNADFTISDSLYNLNTHTRTFVADTPTGPPATNVEETVGKLEFAPNTNIVDFYVRINKNAKINALSKDDQLVLGFKREVTSNSARTVSSTKRSIAAGDIMKIQINQWLQKKDYSLPTDLSVNAIALDSDNNVIVASTQSGTAMSKGNTVGFLRLYSLSGQQAATFATTPANDFIASMGDEQITSLGFNSKKVAVVLANKSTINLTLNYIVVAGTTTGNLDGTNAGGKDVFIASYTRRQDSKTYTRNWVRQFGSSADDIPSSIIVDPDGTIFVTGTTDGALNASGNVSLGGKDAFLASYDATGKQLFLKNFGTAGNDKGVSVLLSSGSTLLVTGQTNGTFSGQSSLGGEDGFSAKFNATTGDLESVKQFGSSSNDFVVSSKMQGSDILTAGYGMGNLGLISKDGVKSINSTLSSLTSQDMFLMKGDTLGNLRDIYQFGGSNNDKTTNLSVGPLLTFVAGVTTSQLVPGANPLGEDFVITALDTTSQLKISQKWQIQQNLPGNQKVVDMVAGKDNKLFVLFSSDNLAGTKTYSLGPFSESDGADLISQNSDSNIPSF